MVSGLDLLQGNRSGVDLLNQKKVSSGLELLLEPQAPVDKTLFPDEMAVAHKQKPVIKPEDFYNKVVGSPYGVMTPELTNYMGRKGFGPKPAGGFDEFGRALDAEGKAYEESFEVKEKTRGVIAETLKGLSVMAMNPMETIKGGLDFVLSLPGFGVGLIGATARGSKELIDQVAIGQTFDLDKVYEAAS
ncbi:MAG: hypothetical protein KKD77_20965, partial [Gammaproteobacteria bacterium]|nr:hypothetical protein [Gammaproteobacteria bacterium]